MRIFVDYNGTLVFNGYASQPEINTVMQYLKSQGHLVICWTAGSLQAIKIPAGSCIEHIMSKRLDALGDGDIVVDDDDLLLRAMYRASFRAITTVRAKDILSLPAVVSKLNAEIKGEPCQ